MNCSVKSSRPTSGIALCLGSSLFGFYAHAGFLDVIVGQGIEPECVVGCSSGAIVAGLHAFGMKTQEIRDFLLDTNFHTLGFEWTMPLCGFAMMANLPGISGLTSGRKLLRRFREAVGDARIEDLPGPKLSIAVTNLTTRRSEILNSGPLADAMLASCAIPVLFRPVKLAGGYCSDGGLANALPVDHFSEDAGIHTVIIHHITHGENRATPAPYREPSIFRACSDSYQVINGQVYRLSYEKLANAGKQLIACRTHTIVPGFFGKKSRGICMEAGAQTARNLSDQWQALAAAKEPAIHHP